MRHSCLEVGLNILPSQRLVSMKSKASEIPFFRVSRRPRVPPGHASLDGVAEERSQGGIVGRGDAHFLEEVGKVIDAL